MDKKDITKLNRSSKDIWALIEVGIKTKNFALLEKNLKRLASLQAYYLELLNFNDYEIQGLKNDLLAERYLTSTFEKEWLEGVLKRSGTYERLKDRIEETFKGI